MAIPCNGFVFSILNLVLCNLLIPVRLSTGLDYTGRNVYEQTASHETKSPTLESLSKVYFDESTDSPRNTIDRLIPLHFKDADYLKRERPQFVSDKRGAANNRNKFDFNRFPRYDEAVQFMQDLVKGSKYGKIITIGRSFEGRPILGLQLEKFKDNPRIFVDAGIHAREWAAPVVALYIMKKIIESEETIAQKLSIYVIPIANPDGYEYTHTDDRFWRKSRSRSENSSCIGTDLNRNFDSFWGVYGVQKDPCSSVFPGYSPFSEVESIAIRDAILTLQPHMYLTLHSYGPMLLYPWGFTQQLPNNWRELDSLARNATAALKKVNGQDYIIGSSTNVLYLASGGSDDWAMQKAGVPLVYTMELPQYGSGFVVPHEKIKPMVTETFAAFQVFMKYVCSKRHSNCN